MLVNLASRRYERCSLPSQVHERVCPFDRGRYWQEGSPSRVFSAPYPVYQPSQPGAKSRSGFPGDITEWTFMPALVR
ncbi:uncharacterized protein BDV14DRAFT_44317 [Aspergillus stella-maris]|uniref:uncharacterized protein n=1 Tax=Aspergillus stella-maris TaxID=1810926 RepID=UPI003CCD9EFC